jgi:hypothetical protein
LPDFINKYAACCKDTQATITQKHQQSNDAAKAHRAEVKANQVSTTLPTSQTAEVALSASVCHAGSLSSNSDAFWIADMGTTSHLMTHWSSNLNYQPHCIPMHIANDAVVYSAGIGDVVTPSNCKLPPCHLTCVLHVPELQNNLLSVLHLVTHHEFKATIEGTCMELSQGGALQFTASICKSTAFMDVNNHSYSH